MLCRRRRSAGRSRCQSLTKLSPLQPQWLAVRRLQIGCEIPPFNTVLRVWSKVIRKHQLIARRRLQIIMGAVLTDRFCQPGKTLRFGRFSAGHQCQKDQPQQWVYGCGEPELAPDQPGDPEPDQGHHRNQFNPEHRVNRHGQRPAKRQGIDAADQHPGQPDAQRQGDHGDASREKQGSERIICLNGHICCEGEP